ncbi:MAG: hypothetical protein GC131_06165 [Alphaproteobacteria bacterium]|nr:hypothetical protein [Alphaproteobacteria bacterium]
MFLSPPQIRTKFFLRALLPALLPALCVWLACAAGARAAERAPRPQTAGAAALAFRSGGALLPGPEEGGPVLHTVGVQLVRLALYELKDREAIERMARIRRQQGLGDDNAAGLLAAQGDIIWRGTMVTGAEDGKAVDRAVPAAAMAGGARGMRRGVYVLEASDAAVPGKHAAYWFTVSDILLTAVTAEDGWHFYARNRATGAAYADVTLRLGGAEHAGLASAVTDAQGHAFVAALEPEFTPNNDRVRHVLAYGPDGGVTALELEDEHPAPEPGPSMLFADRGRYRPGQPVILTGIAPPAGAAAQNIRKQAARETVAPGAFVQIIRAGGLVMAELPLESASGLVGTEYTLPAWAPTGKWEARLLDASGKMLAVAPFDVDDGQGALDVGIESAQHNVRGGESVSLQLHVKDTAGRAAAHISGRLWAHWRATRKPFAAVQAGTPAEAAEYGIYAAGGTEPVPVASFTTDAQGAAQVAVKLPPAPEAAHTPMEAVIAARLAPPLQAAETNAPLALSRIPQPVAIGIIPAFPGHAVPENALAGFTLIAADAAGRRIPLPALTYELVEEQQHFTWYQHEGQWQYRAAPHDLFIARGKLGGAGGMQTGLELPVHAGHYRLDVFSEGRASMSALRFSAGWWLESKQSLAAGKVKLSVMEQALRPGDKGWLFVAPPWPARVMLVLADNKVRQVIDRTVGEDGAFIEVASGADWRRGVNVLAVATEQTGVNDGEARRAEGTAWFPLSAATETVTLALPEDMRADGTAAIPVNVTDNGEQTAVRIVAVPLARSETTRFAPISDAWQRPAPVRVALRDSDGFVFSPAQAETTGKSAAFPPAARAGSTASAVVRTDRAGIAAAQIRLPDSAGATLFYAIVQNGDAVQEVNAHAMLAAKPLEDTDAKKPAVISGAAPAQAMEQYCLPPIGPGENANAAAAKSLHGKLQGMEKAGKAPDTLKIALSSVGGAPFLSILAGLPRLNAAATQDMAEIIVALRLAAGLPGDLPYTRTVIERRRAQLTASLLQRQQGDGGFAVSPHGRESDLAATAGALMAMAENPAAPPVLARQAADWVIKRLDQNWEVERELEARALAFYALAQSPEAVPPAAWNSALHYFISNFGNAARMAPAEAQIAFALARGGAASEASEYRTRALAQMPSLLRDHPHAALATVALLSGDDDTANNELLPLWDELGPRIDPAQTGDITRARLAALFMRLLRRAGVWEYATGGGEPDRVAGLRLLGYGGKDGPLALANRGTRALHACALVPATGKRAPAKDGVRIARRLFRIDGGMLARAAKLENGAAYVVLIDGTFTRPPQGTTLVIKDALPRGLAPAGLPLAEGAQSGQFRWMPHLSAQIASAAGAGAATAKLAPLQGRDFHFAYLVRAARKGGYSWPAANVSDGETGAILARSEAARISVE